MRLSASLPRPGALAGLLAVVLGLALLAVAVDQAGLMDELTVTIQTMQRELHRALTESLRAVRDQRAAAGWTLIGVSLAYGVFHAAGPGHGKLVLSTYLATHESLVARGLLLSLATSLVQGLVAIALVEVTVGLLGASVRQAQRTGLTLETISFGLVALLGVFLAFASARRLFARRAGNHDHHHHHDHAHGHGHGHHAHGHDHGHAHAPPPEAVAGLSLARTAGLVLSIGARPCTGAILVLLVAQALDLRWIGIGAVLAMSLGTAATVAALAVLSIYARRFALRLAADGGATPVRHLARLLDVVGLLGGVAIAGLGLALLRAGLAAPSHPLF